MSEKENKNNSGNLKESVFTKETLGVVLMLFATLMLVCLISRDKIFSVPGQAVNSFLFGCFGYFAYAVIIFIGIEGFLLVSDKKTGLTVKRKIYLTVFMLLTAILVHLATTTEYFGLTYGAYLSKSYMLATEGGITTCTGGGLFTGIIAYLFPKLLTNAGSFILLGVAMAVLFFLFIYDISVAKSGKNVSSKGTAQVKGSYVSETVENKNSDLSVDIEGERDYPVEGVVIPSAKTEKRTHLFVNNADDFGFKTKKDLKIEEKEKQELKRRQESSDGLGGADYTKPYSKFDSEEMKQKLNYIKTPYEIKYDKNTDSTYSSTSQINVSSPISRREPEKKIIPFIEHEEDSTSVSGDVKEDKDSAKSHAEDFSGKYGSLPETTENDFNGSQPETFDKPDFSFSSEREKRVNFSETQTNEEIERDNGITEEKEEQNSSFGYSSSVETPDYSPERYGEEKVEKTETAEEKEESVEQELPPTSFRERRMRDIFAEEPKENVATEGIGFSSESPESVKEDSGRESLTGGFGFGRNVFKSEEKAEEIGKVSEPEPEKEKPPVHYDYDRPPIDLLERNNEQIVEDTEVHEERKQIIQRVLSEFHIDVEPQGHIQGPTITRYEIKMPPGVSVKRVLSFDDDLKMRLMSKNGIRIEAPIPGKDLVGIEVANEHPSKVYLRDVLEGMAKQSIKPSALQFAIGKDIIGEAKSDNLAKGPHYLIAGATGSGKSVALNVMLVSLIMRYSPEVLRLILIDPKRVEFRKYENIPHMLIPQTITDPQKALNALTWAHEEMERRYMAFESVAGGIVSDIDSYNENVANDEIPKMPRIVIVIDELADLMESCKKEFETKIKLLAQKARAAGIHLVLATQRPSVDIITGTIKANLPSRMALKVMNFNDSQTILGEAGAEKLLGNGDMLFKNSSMPVYERYQGAFISSVEINNIVNYIKEHNKAYFDDSFDAFINKSNAKQEETSSSEDAPSDNTDDEENSDAFVKSLALGVTNKTLSISMMQRMFSIGYNKAGRLIEKMAKLGYVSRYDGAKARRVLMTEEEFRNRYGMSPEDCLK